MLELARILCSRKSQSKLNIWIVFFDGERGSENWPDKAIIQWTNTNSTFGSREMAAKSTASVCPLNTGLVWPVLLMLSSPSKEDYTKSLVCSDYFREQRTGCQSQHSASS